MELTNLYVKGFKSVKETIRLLIDKRVTILIGANDHGKSNLLEAVARLNDDRPITKDDIHWDLLKDHPEGEATRIEWHFDCPSEIVQKMQEIVSKSAGNTEATSSEDDQTEQESTTEPEVAVESNEQSEDELDEEIISSNGNNKLVLYRNSINCPVSILSAPIEVPKSKEAEIIALKPRVELFIPPSIDLKDETTLDELTNNNEFEFMQGIFRLADIWDEKDTIFTPNDETTRKLDEASKKLTKVLNTTWNQGKNLDWILKHADGGKIGIFIRDPAVRQRYTRPSLKSSGFQTYFLLSMITYARTAANASNSYIYLFDEPGTNLHPRAQIDLQRSFEALSDATQIVYTTHSLFLINKNYPDRNTVVVKTGDGTQVNIKPFQKNWKAVRESLGILLSNNFLIAEKTVLVEGPSDVIYLLHTIKTLKKLGKIDIDLNDLSIVDAGDQSNYVAMAKLMLEEGRSVLAIIDGDSSGDTTKTQLSKVCGPELESKKLEIKQLTKGHSSENALADIVSLRSAVSEVAKDITDSGSRKLKDGLDAQLVVKNIKVKTGETLGKTIDDTTKAWFEPEEKLSKLSIALKYEDISDLKAVAQEALGLVTEINKSLDLRSEKAYEKGVFEEV